MTIGEKITHLRASVGISQEELADKLGVSRQSVSKWETDQVLPKMETLVSLCDIFSVSADELIRDDVILSRIPPKDEKKDDGQIHNKYFGTDGFRGEAGKDLTSDHAYKVGRFLGWYFASPLSGCNKLQHRPKVVIGKDTRRSSYTLEYALAAGLTASGADAYMLHVTTTPSVSYVTRTEGFDCGIMITASHNPFYDNGIKVINRYGEKLDDKTASLIEAYIYGDLDKIGVKTPDLPLAQREKMGAIIDHSAGRNRYVGYLISIAANSYKGMRIGLDCANGASWMIAKAVFEALGAQTVMTGNTPDGTNVNTNCGSTHIENLQNLVKENHLDVGFAFDGDADRCIAVDEKGEVVDGDKAIYILGKRLKDRGMLDGDTVVTTIMSNSGLDRALSEIGIKNVHTAVGDRFVYEKMESDGFRLGGEQSGHIIIRKHATTGDGILTAIMLTEQIKDSKLSLSTLASPVFLYPQLTKNVRVTSKPATINDPDVKKKVAEVTEKIAGEGRVLLRQSGTEPVVRVMVESKSKALCNEYADEIIAVIRKNGYVCD